MRNILNSEGLKSVKIGSVRSYLAVLENLSLDDGFVYFYRGHDAISYDLKPSLYRNKGWVENEDVLFKELILRCPNDFLSSKNTFDTLVKMQHYSMPTRLLDITSNPLVALYFATDPENELHEDGEVKIFRVAKKSIKYFDSDTVSVISNISRRPFDFQIPRSPTELIPFDRKEREEIISNFNSEDDIKLLLHDIRSEKPHFLPLIDPIHLESVICVKPKLDNARIIRQDGAFFLFGISKSKQDVAEIPGSYIVSSEPVIIKKEDKKKIREQLKLLGVSASTIFPEMESVAKDIKKMYAKSSDK